MKLPFQEEDTLRKADELIRDFLEKKYFVDDGCLIFAATEYQKAYRSLAEERDHLVSANDKLRAELRDAYSKQERD